MQISVSVTGIKELQDGLKNFSERRLNAATATALTRTAVQVRDTIKTAMATSLDRPTPYTVRQLKYVKADAKKLVAVVGFGVEAVSDYRGNVIRYQDMGSNSTPAGKYLHDQIHGGPRRNKRFESALRSVGVLPNGWYVVPGEKAKMDAYGNQSVGEIKQVMTWFDAAERVSGSTQNMGQKGRDKRRKGTRKTAGWEFFLVSAGARRSYVSANGKTGTHKMQPGIYRRTMFALGTRIEPIMIFVNRASYKPRFNFYGMSKREGDRILPAEINRAVNESLARLKGAAA